MTAAELLALEQAMTPGPWRAGTHDTGRLFFPDPHHLAGAGCESVLLRMNEHFPRFREDVAGIAIQRNHAAALAELVRACELWAELGQLPPSIATALARVHVVGAPLWDSEGRPTSKMPDCPRCGEDELGARFDGAWCHACSWRGSLTALRNEPNPPALPAERTRT